MSKKHTPGAVIAATRRELEHYTADKPATAKTIHEKVFSSLGGVATDSVYRALLRLAELGVAGVYAPNGHGDVKRYYLMPPSAAANRKMLEPQQPPTPPRAAAQPQNGHAPAISSATAPSKPLTPAAFNAALGSLDRQIAEMNGHAPAPLPFELDAAGREPQQTPASESEPRSADAQPLDAWSADHARELAEIERAVARADRLAEIAGRGAPATPPVVPRRVALNGWGFSSEHYVADYELSDGSIELWLDALELIGGSGDRAERSRTKRITVREPAELRIVRRFLRAISGDMPPADELERLRDQIELERAAAAAERDLLRADLAAAEQLAAEAEQKRCTAEHELEQLRAWRSRLESIGVKFTIES